MHLGHYIRKIILITLVSLSTSLSIATATAASTTTTDNNTNSAIANNKEAGNKLNGNKSNIKIYKATSKDIDKLVYLAMQRHHDYEKLQPIFWNESKDAENLQKIYFASMMAENKALFFIAMDQENNKPIGIIMAREYQAPPVYNSGRVTYIIDDYYVTSPKLWNSVGKDLLSSMQSYLESNGVTQIIVITANADTKKTQAMKSLSSYKPLSTWYVHES